MMRNLLLSKASIGLWVGAVLWISVATVPDARAQSEALPGLVSWWRGDGDATDAADGNDGTLLNGTSFAAGQVGQAFSFDGNNDHVLIGNPANLNFGTGDFSVTAWVRTSFTGGIFADFIVSKTSSGQDQQFILAYVAGPSTVQGAPFFNVRSVTAGAGAFAPCSIADGLFHHLAGVREGTVLRIYVDGQLAETVTSSEVVSATSSNNVVIGGRQNSGNDPYFNGLIDEVQIYGRALSASEVQELFDAHGDSSSALQCGCSDDDGDGFGSPGALSCLGGSAEDCDDADGSVFPGAPELCDGEDNDCDGLVPADELDADEDGFRICEGDCDDSNPSLNPDAVELPGNFIDENCDGNLGNCDPCSDWRNHGEYVRCVAHAAEDLVTGGGITQVDADELVSSAARSEVGKKGFVPPECQ